METAEIFAGNRARGTARFTVAETSGVTRRGYVFEDGSLRVRFPSSHSNRLAAVLVNTAGGIAGGDRFSVDINADAGSSLSVTTASAEKVYRSHGPDAVLDVSLRVGQGARLHWLPQETILFDRAQVRRKIDIDLADGASLLLGEMVVFGRAAMNEALSSGRFIDSWRLRVGGRLVFADTVRLDGEIGPLLAQRAISNGAAAIATLLIVPGTEEIVENIRELSLTDCEIGVSSWNGFAIARLCGQDAASVRNAMMAVLARVAPMALPRLWLQ